MELHYQPGPLELKIQQAWKSQSRFQHHEDMNSEKFYCLSMFPYPSGQLHMGHVRNYTIGDAITRYQLMLGKNVMQPMGWDAFGLPAENAAIKHNEPPAKWTEENIHTMKAQFERLGFAFDWDRELTTCDPKYYHWEQWLFVQLFKKGLVYRKNSVVNWDPVDQTVLANEQVIDGKGWRSGAVIERREIPQWFIKIRDYADELVDSVDQLDQWPEQVKTMQRNWIGRSYGTNIQFSVVDSATDEIVNVYTTRADTLFGATYIGIAMQHPIALRAAAAQPEIQQFLTDNALGSVSEAVIATQEKKGIFTGYYAQHPLTQQPLPIWVTNFVLMEYGTGAVMSVPAHDQRDFEFAQVYQLPIQPVIQPPDSIEHDFTLSAYTDTGTLIHSGEFNDIPSVEASKKITAALEKQGAGEAQTHYRLRDWGISRQRYWGTPIPIIYCDQCGPVPVPEDQLPITLPTHLIPDGKSSPLKSHDDFISTTCPTCGAASQRETDTMDTFVESSWYYARYCSFDQDKAILDDRVNYWTPVDQYIGGIEHAVMHLLYARFFHKILRDLGLVNSDEPFTSLLTQGMVLKDGCKMSKSKGNTVSPVALIERYGADTLRLFSMFAAPPEQAMEWSDSAVEGCYRFLKKLWHYCGEQAESLTQQTSFSLRATEFEDADLKLAFKELNTIIQKASFDMQRYQFNTVVSAGMKIFNLLQHTPINNAAGEHFRYIALGALLRILSPFTPHICQTLWQELNYGSQITEACWPKVNQRAMDSTECELMVQINGKLRSKILVTNGADDNSIKQQAMGDPNIQRHLADKSVKRIIVVPKKLINIVV